MKAKKITLQIGIPITIYPGCHGCDHSDLLYEERKQFFGLITKDILAGWYCKKLNQILCESDRDLEFVNPPCKLREFQYTVEDFYTDRDPVIRYNIVNEKFYQVPGELLEEKLTEEQR